MKGYENFLTLPNGAKRMELEDDLLQYYKLDTSVMVDIWKSIQKIPDSP